MRTTVAVLLLCLTLISGQAYAAYGFRENGNSKPAGLGDPPSGNPAGSPGPGPGQHGHRH